MSDWFSAEQHAQQAHEFFESGQWERALAELKRAIEINPYEGEWHFGMGLTLDALHRFDEAAESFEKAMGLRGEDVETMLHLGVDLIRSGKPRRAVELLARVTELDPASEAAYCHRIAAYAQLGEHEEAELMFYMARQLIEECPVCYDHLAHSLAMRQQLDRAVWCWQQTHRIDPQYPDVCSNIARVYWQQGQFEQARQYFLKQLRQDPGDIQALLNTGNLLLEMNRLADAAEKFHRVLEIDPTVADAHVALGELALIDEKFDTGKAQFQIARQLDPTRVGVNFRLSQILTRQGHHEQARRLLQAESQLQDHPPELALDIARVQLDMQMPTAAQDLLSRTIRHLRRSPQNHQVLAAAYLTRARARMMCAELDQAILDARLSLRLAPQSVAPMHLQAVAYMEQQRFWRAQYWLSRAIEHSPGDAVLRKMKRKLRYAAWRSRLAGAADTLLRALGVR